MVGNIYCMVGVEECSQANAGTSDEQKKHANYFLKRTTLNSLVTINKMLSKP